MNRDDATYLLVRIDPDGGEDTLGATLRSGDGIAAAFGTLEHAVEYRDRHAPGYHVVRYERAGAFIGRGNPVN